MRCFKSSIGLAILALSVFFSCCPKLVESIGCNYYPKYPNMNPNYITT